jgi:hypothetical protein
MQKLDILKTFKCEKAETRPDGDIMHRRIRLNLFIKSAVPFQLMTIFLTVL